VALVGVAACGGGGGDDDSPADTAKGACKDLGDFLVDAGQAGDSPTQEQAQALLEQLQGIDDDVKQALSEDSAYIALSTAFDQLVNGLETANQTQIETGYRNAPRQCLQLFPELQPTQPPQTSAPPASETTEP
jgi:hypothetical protein